MEPASLCLCIALLGGQPIRIPTDRFELSWIHSVEKMEWREEWTVQADGIKPSAGWVKGSGAGMEPPAGSRLKDGWWVYEPEIPVQDRVVFAASTFTATHTLCVEAVCQPLDDWIDRPPGDERPVEFYACQAVPVSDR